MAWVADYTARISPSALKAAGVVGVCRYVSRSAWKVIGKAEYAELQAAGIAVVLNFEDEADGWLGGAAAGKADAEFAVAAARALGYPAGAPIPSSADFNMTSAQWSGPGRAYAVAYRDGVRAGDFTEGVYGPSDVLGWCKTVDYRWFWQAGMSTSWSGGRNASPWPGAHLRQRRHQMVGGVDVDVNDILRSDWITTGDIMARLTDAEQQELLRLVRNTERGVTATIAGTDPIAFPAPWQTGQKPSPNPVGALLAAIKAIPAGGAPTQEQVTTAVAAVMNDPVWLDKLGAAVGKDLATRLGNG